MNESEAFVELFGRVAEHVHEVVEGLSAADLVWSPAPGANSIGWLVWHLTRVQDDHVADLLDEEQLWETGPWAPRFGLTPDPGNTGYGHSADDVASVRPDGADVLVAYYDAVAARTICAARPSHVRRPRPGRRRAVGSARDDGRPPGQHRRRRHPARRTGRLRARSPRPSLTRWDPGPPDPSPPPNASAGFGRAQTWVGVRYGRSHGPHARGARAG